jgi:hypothetical protein
VRNLSVFCELPVELGNRLLRYMRLYSEILRPVGWGWCGGEEESHERW